MRSLHELQRTFASAVVEGDARPLRDWLVGACDLDAEAAIAIYRNNVFSNYRNALRDDYPAVLALVGEEFFGGACDAYAREQPSQSGDLNEFGAAFPHFLAHWPPASALVYLPDVAHLEWVIHLAFNAADAQPLPLHALAEIAQDRLPHLHFRLHPAAHLLSSRYPVLRIWQVSGQGARTGETVDLDAGAARLLVHRRGLSVEVEPLALGEWTMLQALAADLPLADAYASAAEHDAAFDLGAFLQRYILGATIVSFHHPPTSHHNSSDQSWNDSTFAPAKDGN